MRPENAIFPGNKMQYTALLVWTQVGVQPQQLLVCKRAVVLKTIVSGISLSV